MQSSFGILSMIQQGYYATYPLLFISVVCLAIIFERLWALWGIGPQHGQAGRLADPATAARQVQRSAAGDAGARHGGRAHLSHA